MFALVKLDQFLFEKLTTGQGELPEASGEKEK